MVSIGETLARARRTSGLRIAEISRRTRLSRTVIYDIEHDNYAACGGDDRARAHIAAIARALGVDSGPLIEAYDARRHPAAIPAGPSEPVGLAYADRHPFIWIALGGALLAVAALGGILVVVGGTSGQATRPAFAAGHRAAGRGPARRTQAHQSPSHSGRSPGRIRPASPRGSRPGQVLVPDSIVAFGPGGTGQGDSPQLARQALAGKSAAPWHSDWYTTPHFGNLQAGTGLLLDMGRPVMITSARIALGSQSGADLLLRIGNSPALASLQSVAHANGAAGVVWLKTAPTRGRYVLLWFTRLPPDQAGTYQVSVYDIKLRGQS